MGEKRTQQRRRTKEFVVAIDSHIKHWGDSTSAKKSEFDLLSYALDNSGKLKKHANVSKWHT